MKNFPKKIYVVAYLDDDNNINEWEVKTNIKDFAESENPDTEVAVYELSKVGYIHRINKVVFE